MTTDPLARVAELERQVLMLRKALRFYAIEWCKRKMKGYEVMDPSDALTDDAGERARAALTGTGDDVLAPFQARVHDWMLACFGPEIAADAVERNHRFLEEALELVQACGCTASEAHQLVDYTFGRPVGEKWQEVGGVVVTLAALCTANMITMDKAGENELERIWTKVEQIRAKQAAKPAHSPLPAAPTDGWIEWKGGKWKGADDDMVFLRGRMAVSSQVAVRAGSVDWVHLGRPNDIMFFRLATPTEGK